MMPDDMTPLDALVRHGEERDALLRRIGSILERDRRVGALWLSGSFGRGEADAWSDLDLCVAVADVHYGAFLDERAALFQRVGAPYLVQQDMPSDSMLGGRFTLVLYPGALEVDWNIGPVGQALRPLASCLLFDHVGIPDLVLPALTADECRAEAERWLVFFWAMAPIALKYAGRAESRRAASQIDLLTRALIVLWRLVREPVGTEPSQPAINQPLDPALAVRLPRLGAVIDPAAALDVIESLCAEVEQLHPALAALGAVVPAAAREETAMLARLAKAVIQQ